MAYVRATPSVGRPRELTRASATSTLPGGATSNVLASTTRPMGPTIPSAGPSEGDAAILPLLHYGAFPGRGFAGEHLLGQMPRRDQWVE